jgi:ubiquinone/menaquinone biosynthesis C-methylase UbiE
MPTKDEIRESVRQRYREAALDQQPCCGTGTKIEMAVRLGYELGELHSIPAEANLGLGCGNPTAIARLKPGDVVLDLGSGAGFDCFLAARHVGQRGHVIGVDMTPEMIAKARLNAQKMELKNIEFRLGEIEHLPVADASVDVIISNCVINLSPDKPRVYREAFRVLKPGGRLAISDIVLLFPLPEQFRGELSRHYAECVAGAATADELREMLSAAGFVNVSITLKDSSREFIKDWSKEFRLEEYIASADIEAAKPV